MDEVTTIMPLSRTKNTLNTNAKKVVIKRRLGNCTGLLLDIHNHRNISKTKAIKTKRNFI